jgi:hypothetical protein
VPPRANLPTIAVAERHGLVWLCPGEPAASISEMVVDADPSFRRINTGVAVWRVSAPRMVDNFLDISTSRACIGEPLGAQEPRVPSIDLVDLDDGYHGHRYEVVARNPEEAQASSGSDDAVVGRVMTSGFCPPLVVRSTIAYDTGPQHLLLLLSSLIDEVTSCFTFVAWRNDDFDVPAEEVVAVDRAIGEEDRQMLERLSGEFSLEQTAPVEWRRRFTTMLGA